MWVTFRVRHQDVLCVRRQDVFMCVTRTFCSCHQDVLCVRHQHVLCMCHLDVTVGTPRMSHALDIDLGRNKAAAITVFDAILSLMLQFAMHFGKGCIKFDQDGLIITSEINVDLVRQCEVFRMQDVMCVSGCFVCTTRTFCIVF
jgi:hypothetical protein